MSFENLNLATQLNVINRQQLGIPELDEEEMYAAIDLGSNSFHMIIARQAHGQMQVVDKHKEMVRLRSGLDKKGYLNEEAFSSGIACLERFGQRIKGIKLQNIRAVGTNTLRNAKNSREFLLQARQALGTNIQIISGQEEARLIYLGVTLGMPKSDEQRLVMDIGGGSTEYIIGKRNQHHHLTSTEMGCVSITEKFFANEQINADNFRAAIDASRNILRPHRQQLISYSWDSAIGASGTIKSIGQILEQNQWSEGGITLAGMQTFKQALIDAGNSEHAKINGLKDERRPVICGGLAILIATFIELNITTMQVSINALREGLIFDTLGRLHADDVRNVSVQAMQKWMKVDEKQADAVFTTALHLFKQAHNVWGLHSESIDYQSLLRWASQLHECGIAISYKRYRNHSAYLVEQSDMAGFDQQEKQILSAMLLNHRGKFSSKALENIDKDIGQQILYLSVLLRLAVRVHRGRDLEKIEPELQITTHDDGTDLTLIFADKWLEEHPLSQLDLESEAKRLAAIGFNLSFK
ncbi:exopolyphosphatase [Thiosulfatimonas sediminis]|uniref:Exopolyphosphatase n=1 Tax=Thiosulfatimonas sediminis TaxID=2675054 RepID=A0A6F8PXL3_9GAMM|nr:exopolyphosphatase [Thiosulfatimonas sediminis]BBP46883.1 exopolyphosphatase [Thiosulfatimonas sediminis]